jgi:hypothetical protein
MGRVVLIGENLPKEFFGSIFDTYYVTIPKKWREIVSAKTICYQTGTFKNYHIEYDDKGNLLVFGEKVKDSFSKTA